MSLEELLSSLDRMGIRLSARDGRLVVDAPTGSLTEELRGQLAARKGDLLTLLDRNGGDRNGGGKDEDAAPAGASAEGTIPHLRQRSGVPASPAQRRLWLLQTLDPEDSRYNVNLLLELTGRIDAAAIACSLDALAERHEILRSVAREDAGEVVIDLLDRISVPLEDRKATPDEADALIEAAMARPFAMRPAGQPDDGLPEPLLRALLLRTGPDRAQLLLTFHHMAVDEESLKILARDWSRLYRHPEEATATPVVQHADAADWLRRRLDGATRERLLAHWTEVLGGEQPALTLPADPAADPSAGEHAGARIDRKLPRATVERIGRLCAERRLTPYVLLLAAYQWTLSRWSGQRDLRVATPVSERSHPALEGVVGPMINTLVMRSIATPGMTGAELLDRTRRTVLDGQRHAGLPFELLVDHLRPARDVQGEPLAQTMFNYLRGGERATLELGDLTATVLPVPERSAKFDLSLFVTAPAGSITLSFQYRTARFAAATVERFADHLLHVLDALLTATDRPLDGLAALPAMDLSRQRGWNATAVEYGGFVPLGRLLSDQAARSPGAVALQWEEDSVTAQLTYADLDRRANRLAHWLIAAGCRPDDRVALCLERSPELVVAILATLKAGCAWLPLDPDHPPQRLAAMVEDGGARLILAHRRTADRLPADPLHAAPVHLLDPAVSLAAGFPDTLPDRPVDPAQLAYALFTSGSTGRPKAVGVPQAGLLNRLRWMQDRYRLSPADAVLQKTPYGFDVSVWEFLWPLLTGARLVLAGPGEHRDARRLAELIERHGITTLHFVPAMLQAFLDALPAGPKPEARCPSVSRVLCSGEALPASLRDRCTAALPRAELHNLYGPTEASIDVTAWDCRSEAGPSVPIGHPIANIRSWVLDDALNPVPVGVAGELYLAGVGLARGYLGRPDLTAAAFLPNPLYDPATDAPDQQRLYRTGDLARHRPDGAIEYLGRADFQVKIRGQRVELGEIEAALAALPQVAEAVVAACGDRQAGGSMWLTAWLTAKAGHALPDPDALRGALADRLPDHMVPAVFVTLDRMPVNQNGKIDRKALPQPQPPQSGGGEARNEVESILVALWQKLLRVDDIGIHDNFFVLGGDSIVSLQLSAQARLQGLSFEPRAVFRHQTIAALAAHAGRDADAARSDVVPPAGQAPLTGIQRWFFDSFDDGRQDGEGSQPVPDHANQAVLLASDDRIDDGALRRALTALLTDHPMLSARFRRNGDGTGGDWTQEIPAVPAPLSLHAVTIAESDPERRLAAIDALVASTQAGLSLSDGRLFAAALIRLGEGGDRLLLAVHHLAVDGVSWRILLDDLAAGYAAALEGREVPRRPSSVSFRHWALEEEARRAAMAPETAHGPGLPADGEALPFDRPLPVEGCRVRNQRRHSVTLPAEQARHLVQSAPTAFRAGPEALCLTALARTLQRWRTRRGSAPAPLTLFVEGHGRDLLPLDSSRTVGWFTRLQPLRLFLEADRPLAADLLATRAAMAEASGSGTPYLLRRNRSDDAAASASGILFNFLGHFQERAGAFRRAPEPLGHFRAPGNRLPFPIEVNASLGAAGLTVSWQTAGEVLDIATVEELAADMLDELHALAALCADPAEGGALISDFPLADLAPDDLDRIAQRHPLGRVEDILRLSPMQRGMLLYSLGGDTSGSGDGQYVSQTVVRCEGVLDADLLQQACQRTIDRHPALRTAFLLDGTPHQVVLRRTRFALRWESLLDADAVEQADAMERIRREDRAALALDRPPLLRCSVLRLAPRSFRIVWTIHHLVMDGWSLPILTGEVLRHYDALRRGLEAADLPAPVPYRDFIAWLGRRDAEADALFWREELAGFPGATPLPGAWKRSGLGYHTEEHGVDGRTAATLRRLCSDRRLTLNSVIQGVWALVLARHAGTAEVTVGVTLAGRPADLPGADRCLGTFINTVPLRLRPEADRRLSDFLALVQDKGGRIAGHGHAPLAGIRGWAGNPDSLFDSILVSEALPPGEAAGTAGLVLTRETTEVRNSYPLTLRVVPGETLRFDLLIDHDRIDPAVPRRMLADLQMLLADLPDLIDQPLGALYRRLAPTDGDVLPAEDGGCALSRLLAQPGDAAALDEGGRKADYAALAAAAGRVAARLKKAGCGAGGVVAIVLPRTNLHIQAMVASWWLGAAWVALDPALPPARLGWMADDSGAAVAAGEGDRPDWLPAAVAWVDLGATMAEPLPIPAPVRGLPERAAYLLYTSGSTGRPKGVTITHGNLVAYVDGVMPHLDLPTGASLATLATVSADLGLTSVFGALLTGRCLSLVPPELAFDPPGLARHLAANPVDALKIVPGHLLALLAVEEPARILPRRCLILGGESLPPAAFERLRQLAPGLRIVNHYGPTETTIGAAAGLLDGDAAAPLPVGRPLAGARAYVLDGDLEPVAGRAVGELYIGGLGVARGYHRRAGMTAERFLPDPWLPGRRMYRTGDLVRRDAEGRLTILGRCDDQVKIRGFRVEPGELRQILAGLPGVEDAAVLVLPGPAGVRLGALAVAPGRSAEAIRDELSRLVPDQLLPAELRCVGGLPLTANGKLDRQAAARLLAAPAASTAAPPAPAPTDAREESRPSGPDRLERLIALWAEILGRDSCGPDDHFFRLGGDSILCLRLIARASTAGLRLTARLVFENPTPALLAAALAPATPAQPSGTVPTGHADAPAATADTAGLLRPIWAELLHREPVADDDHFFRSGGDSITALRLIAMAARQGIRLTARDLFEHPVFADLVRHLDTAMAGTKAAPAEPPPTVSRPATGAAFRSADAALAPIQHWFLEVPQPRPDHWNQAVMLALPERPEGLEGAALAAALESAVKALAAAQPMLRARLGRSGGAPLLSVAEDPDPHIFAAVACADEAAERDAVASAHGSLSLRDGPLFRAVLLVPPAGSAREMRLLLVAHHLVVDGVSWRVIAADLRSAFAVAARREHPVLPAPMSFGDWTAALAAQPDEMLEPSRRYWAALAASPGWGELVRGADPGTLTGLRKAELTLDAGRTAALARLPEGMEATLLSALVRALAEWQNRDDLVIELEGHGREPDAFGDGPLAALDPSRTVGWFTSRYPVHLRNDPSLPDGGQRASIRRQLDAVPGRGLGYGLLRYLRQGEALPPHPQLVFNYLGQVRSIVGGDAGNVAGGWRLLPDAAGQARHPDSRRRQLIDVTAQLRDGELHIVWSYPARLPQGPFVKATADRVLDLLDSMAEPPVGEAQAETGGTAGHLPARLPLTPLQQGMLWHTLAAPGEGFYVNQTAVRLDGPLDVAAFTAAWQDTVAAEAILRTGFHAGGAEGPEQTVLPAAVMPWQLEDWSGLGEAEAHAGLRQLMAEDRAAGFRLDDPPLMRLHILRLADDRHWLLWTRHHLIVDAWSTGLLIGDVFQRYRSRLGGALPAPTPRPPFADYVAWLARRDAGADDAFWTAELAGAEPLPDFPAGAEDAGFRLTDHRLPDGIADAARTLARDAGVTLNSVVQAAWALALSHRTGRSDILFGMTTAGRPPSLAGSDRILGPFINTVPVRIRLNPAYGVQTLLDQVQRHGLAVREHEHTPLTDIQRRAGIQRGDSLFQSLLIFENESMGEAADIGDGLRLAPLSGHERTNYPLTVTVLPRNGLTLRVAHDGRRIADEAVSALLTEFAGVLTEMAEDGRRPIGTLPRIPSTVDGGVEHGPRVVSVPGWWVGSAILARAGETPDAVAVETASGPLTYGMLVRSARAIARSLRRRGIGPERRVAIALERGPTLVPCLLGVLLAGAAYVPLDPAQPQSRIADILAQADASLLVAPPGSAHIETVSIDTATPDALIRDGQATGTDGSDEGDTPDGPAPCPHPDQAAYVIFTSGSTGRPKGVTVRHAGLSNLLRAMATRLPLQPQDRWLAVTTVGFDIAALEIFAPLVAGATVVLAPETAQRDPAALLRLAERHKAGVLQATPASWAMLAELDSPAWTGLRALTGGEALPAPLAARLLARGVSLLNVYGPTETTIWSTAIPVATDPAGIAADAPAMPIGGPLDNTGLYVLDGALNPLPPGTEGELWIGGDGLARGYHRRPDLTAAAFLPDPFDANPGARMYRTGDLVRRRADGALVFLGRRDFQVKLRGHRIELGDIEAALLAQPGVAAAVVRLWDGGPGCGPDAAFLAAYAAGPAAGPAPDANLDGDRLRAALAERLPAAMVPAVVTVLPALPLNPNGKIDRNALPRPGKPRTAMHAPPQGDTEIWLAGLWRSILGTDAVGRGDDFFALGGNSLSATRLVAAIRDRLDLPTPFTMPFVHPVLKDMAAELRAAGLKDGETLVTLQSARSESSRPLFLFHPAGGHVRSYVPLVQALGVDATMCGLQSPQLADPTFRPNSIGQLADLYTGLIRRRQPEGPYRLFGWSFGGWLAAAVAARLEAAGAAVEWVGVVDARTDLARGRLDLPDLPLATPFIACLDGAMQRRLLDAHRPACRGLERELAALPEAARAERALDWFRTALPAAMDRPRDLQALQMRLFMDCHRLMRDFALPEVAAPLHVWWADQTLSDTPFRKGADPDEWAGVGRTNVRVIDGDHQSILRTRELAQALRALLT